MPSEDVTMMNDDTSPGQVGGVGSCRTGTNPGRFLSETTKIFAAGFRPPDPTEPVPDSSRFFQILPDFVGFRQNPTISGPESGRKDCLSWVPYKRDSKNTNFFRTFLVLSFEIMKKRTVWLHSLCSDVRFM